MRRITFVIVVTAAILTLLFSYRTSTSGPLVSSSVTSKAHVLTPVATVTTTSGPPTPEPSSTAQITTSKAATSTASKPATSGAGSSTKSSSSKTSAAIGSSPTAAATTIAPTTAQTAPVVVDGASAMTRYGPIQVEVTISAGKITDVQAIQYPNQDPRDQEINSQAIPVLHDQVIAAQSANVDGVSGATYTTQGYATSLQSALDAANFK